MSVALYRSFVACKLIKVRNGMSFTSPWRVEKALDHKKQGSTSKEVTEVML
jgi:hypothetical protein